MSNDGDEGDEEFVITHVEITTEQVEAMKRLLSLPYREFEFSYIEDGYDYSVDTGRLS